MKRMALATTLSTAFLVTGIAHAASFEAPAPKGGLYLTGKVGYSQALEFNSAATEETADRVNGILMHFDAYVPYGGAIGYQFAAQGNITPRLDFEVMHQHNDINRIIDGSGTTFNTNAGIFDLTTFMVNGYVDFAMTDCVSLYSGMGIGLAHIEANGRLGGLFYNGEDTAFAMHGTIGASYEAMDSFTLFVEGRYLSVNNPEFSHNNGTSTISVKHQGNYETASVIGGVRYVVDMLG